MTERYRRHPDMRLTALEGEGVVLHLGTRRYFTVSETGLALLDALVQPRTLQELVMVLVDRYEVTPAHAESSARAFIQHCRESELLTIDDGPP